MTLRIIQATGRLGRVGRKSVFFTKINVSSGIKIDNNLSHFRESRGATDTTMRPQPYTVCVPI